jgi:hypothetical protein
MRRSVVTGPDLPAPIGPYSQECGPMACWQAFKNLEAVLQAGGSRLDLVASTTVLVADVGDR